MSWLKNIFGGGKSDSSAALSPKNREFLGNAKNSTQECITVLRACQTREQVIQGLLKIARGGYDVSPVAANAAQQLSSQPSLDAFRIRDDFIRTLETFLSSTAKL